MDRKLSPRITVRLFKDEKCFGPGIAALLRRVEVSRSLRSAAASMGMAYSKAWSILKSCEKNLGFKLVESTIGGKNGGGAVLTDEARATLAAFDSYRAELEAYAEALCDEKFAFLNERSDSEAEA